MKNYPKVPGLGVPGESSNLGLELHLVRNKSGGDLAPGDVCCLDVTAASHALGEYTPVVKCLQADDTDVAGVVWSGNSTIPNGGVGLLQVSGLHTGVKVSNAGGALTAGDYVGPAGVSGVGGKSPVRLGTYVDANYNSWTVATKQVFLHNPAGLHAHRGA